MDAIILLIKSQFKVKKGSYLSIFFLTLIIGLMLSTSLSLVANINSSLTEALDASNFGDLYMLYLDAFIPSEDEIEKLEDMEEFEDVRALPKIKTISPTARIKQWMGK